MCCFSRRVIHVAKTRIFARKISEDRQVLIYSLDLQADEDLAMVLPLPVPPQCPEDSVRFVDLSGYPTLFDDMSRAFPMPVSHAQLDDLGFQYSRAMPQAKLAVHNVGDFEASFVPSIRDFGRLEPRFQMPNVLWEKIPHYADYGFAVFKLKNWGNWFSRHFGKARKKTFHPMAFEFPIRPSERVFFPTVHVHDGQLHFKAEFDHELYWQGSPHSPVTASTEGDIQTDDLSHQVYIDRTQGLVLGKVISFKRTLNGMLENSDTWV